MRHLWRAGWAALLCGALLAGCGGPAGSATQAPPGASPSSAASSSNAPSSSSAAQPSVSAAQPAASSATAAPAPYALAVDFADTRHGWAIACGTSAQPTCTILATNDGGTAWGAQYRIAAPLAHLQFLDAADGFATGGPAVLRTTDGGAFWSLVRHSGPNLHSVDFLTPEVGWAASGGALVRTSDSGAAWSSVAVPGACQLGSVDFPTPTQGWAGGRGPGGPCLLRTVDAGHTWTLVFDSAAASALQPVLAAWEKATGMTSPAGAVVGNMKDDCPVDVHFTSAEAGWLALNCGVYYTGALIVLHTADGGHSWAYAWGLGSCLMGCRGDTGGEQPLFFLSGTAAWRLGPQTVGTVTVQRTLDGGAVWSSGGPNCDQLGCRAVTFLDAVHGWMAAAAGIFATDNGGATWVPQWPKGTAST